MISIYNKYFLGLSIHQSNLEVTTNHSYDIGFIEARQEDQQPAILHEKDPEDVTSTKVPIVTTESSEMTEEGEGEDFRDGSLLVHQVRKRLNTVLVATECFHDTIRSPSKHFQRTAALICSFFLLFQHLGNFFLLWT